MNDLKRKEEVNERDGSVETKGLEATNKKGLDMKGRGKFKTKGTRYREQKRKELKRKRRK